MKNMNGIFKFIVIIAPAVMALPVKEDTESVWVVTGGRAELPCKSSPKVISDQPTIVLWYISSGNKPIYSYDAREVNFTSGVRWWEEGIVGGRAQFYPLTHPGPLLVLEPALASDQGSYTCRVDYRVSPPTVFTVNLTVVIPPGPPTVFFKDRAAVGSVGPIKENERVDFTCKSAGGRPAPTITWWTKEKILPILDAYTISDYVTGASSVLATLSVTGRRDLQGAIITCRVHTPTEGHLLDSPFLFPKTTSVILNVTLPPAEVRIRGPKTVIATSGSRISLVCQASGAHPPAQLTWWNEETSLETFFTQTTEDGGNTTTSKLTMTAEKEDDDSTLSCQAVNPSIPEHILRDTVSLVVYYSPVVTLSLGSALDPLALKEGADVYFECHVKANPRHHRIQWFRNGMELSQNQSAGVVLSGSSLVLQGLQRSQSGTYKCSAANLQGNATSNEVELNVRHSPVCLKVDAHRTQGAVFGETTKVRCQVEAEPSDNITWMWMRMKADGTEQQVEHGLIHSQGLSSSIEVTPLGQEDYGRLLCRATNNVGKQRVPCVISLVPAGPPDIPANCSALPHVPDNERYKQREAYEAEHSKMERKGKEDESSIMVKCLKGFDGGVRQFFVLEAWEDGRLLANVTSDIPEWILRGIRMGAGVTIKIAAHNSLGHSDPLALQVQTSKAQQHAASDSKGIFDWAPLLGAITGAVGVLLLLLVVCAFIVRRKPPRPLKIQNNLFKTSGLSDGFDPDVVQSIQKQPSGLDVLSCLEENQSGNTSGCPDSGAGCSQRYSGVSNAKDQQCEQLYDDVEGKLSQLTSLPSPQQSANKKRRKENQGLHHTTSPSDDSGLTESELDSDTGDLISRRGEKSVEKVGCENSVQNMSTDGGLVPNNFTMIEQLTEPSSSSGDSGIQSLSSTKPFSFFAKTDERSASQVSTGLPSFMKAHPRDCFSSQAAEEHQMSPLSIDLKFSEYGGKSRISTTTEMSKSKALDRHPFSQQTSEESRFFESSGDPTTMSKEFLYQVKAQSKTQDYLQSSGEHLISPMSARFKNRIPHYILQPKTSSTTPTNQSNMLNSKDMLSTSQQFLHYAEVTDSSYMTKSPFTLSQETKREDERNLGKPLGTGTPATLLKGDHDDVLLLSKTLPRSFSSRNRRNSTSELTAVRDYDTPTTLYSSLSELYCVSYPTSAIRDFRENLNRERLEMFSADGQSFSNIRQGISSSRSNKDTMVMVKGRGEKEYKFPFNFNYPERESSV